MVCVNLGGAPMLVQVDGLILDELPLFGLVICLMFIELLVFGGFQNWITRMKPKP